MRKKIIWQDKKENPQLKIYKTGEIKFSEAKEISRWELIDLIQKLAYSYAKGVNEVKETFSFWEEE